MRWSLFALALVLGTGCGGEVEGDDSGECSDGADNDKDGDFDCDDADCAGAPDCEVGPTNPGTGTGTGTGTGAGPGTGTGTGTGDSGFYWTGTGSGSGCQISEWPSANAIDVYYRTSVEARLDHDASGGEVITVSGVAGTTSAIDDRVVFTPSAPLAQNTSYTATLSYPPCTDVNWQFTTGDTGGSVSAGGLVDSVYEVDLGAGRFVRPPGVGSLIGGIVGDPILFGVAAADAVNIDMDGAITAGAGQDMCAATFALPAGDFSNNPYFEAGPARITLDIQGVPTELSQARWTGAFSPSADAIDGLTMEALMDVSALADLVGSDPCNLLITFGVQCVPCPVGGNDCLDLLVDSMVAPRVSTAGITPRTPQDIACDSSCGTPPTGCP